MNQAPREKRHERGVVLIWVALFLILLIGFASLAMDGAKLMATRTQLQNAADAGALAGASAIVTATATIDPTLGRARARTAATSNRAYRAALELVSDVDVEFPSADQIKVTTHRRDAGSLVTQLAYVIGVQNLAVEATATAQLSRPDCVFGIRPLGVGNSTLPFTYVRGQEYALQTGFGSGNYQHLDFSRMDPPVAECDPGNCAGVPSTGGDLLRCMIQHGLNCCVEMHTRIGVQTGVSTGPIRQAVDSLFANDAVQTPYPAGATNSYPVYVAAGGSGSRVIIVPLVEFSPPGGAGNNTWAQINGFAAFFLKRRVQPGQLTFYGEFIDYAVPGDGTGGDGTVFTIRLIK